MEEIVFSVSDFVAVFNQTLEYAYPSVSIVGELSNFRISKNRWVYFDLKDESSSVKFFGTVHQLTGPLEDGLMLQVRGTPRLHQLYGFSVNIQFLSPVGVGSIKKAASLLEAKLTKEGLFDDSRKRPVPYPPNRVGLITSGESAAYHDFRKIMDQRWVGVDVQLANVQVQGEVAAGQIITAIDYFNSHASPVDILVITRGGGSADDLSVFNNELVVRSVAGSRIPTLVAIGHEVDTSLAELAADRRASTPSNAAELLFPDKQHVLQNLASFRDQLSSVISSQVSDERSQNLQLSQSLNSAWRNLFENESHRLFLKKQILTALSPELALRRGYTIIRHNKQVVRSLKQLKKGINIGIEFHDGSAKADITELQ